MDPLSTDWSCSSPTVAADTYRLGIKEVTALIQRPPDVANNPVQPFWTVQTVFDPDGTGHDFAYTIGLARRGLPELHVWARPTDGLDPGEDWKFSDHDRCRLLNEFADLLLRGRLEVGDEVERTYDAGAAHVTFTVGGPVEPLEVEALGVPPGASVLPLRWRLVREPVGQPAGVTDEDGCRADLVELLAAIPVGRKAPPGWRRPRPTASFRLDQPFGPLTPLVRAQGIAIATATPVDLVDFVTRELDADSSFGSRTVLGVTAASARPGGRVAAVVAARSAAEQIVRHVCGPSANSARWRQVLAITGMGGEETPVLHRGISGVLLEGTQAVLTFQTVADIADPTTRLAALGPWRAATSPSGMVAGPEWFAPAPVLTAVRNLLAPLDAMRVALLGHVHLAARDSWADLLMQLRGWAVTSPAGAPEASALLRGTPPGALLYERPDIDVLVTEWVCCMTAALSNRAHLNAEEVDRLHVPTKGLVPGLRDVLNHPVEAPFRTGADMSPVSAALPAP